MHTVQVNLFQKLLFLHQLTSQYDYRLYIELQVQYMKIPSSENGENMLCTEIDFDIQNNFCTQHVLPMFCKDKSFWQIFNCMYVIFLIIDGATNKMLPVILIILVVLEQLSFLTGDLLRQFEYLCHFKLGRKSYRWLKE